MPIWLVLMFVPTVYSGPYSGTDGGAKKFVVNVTSNDPVYYFCSVQRHCQYVSPPDLQVSVIDIFRSGMVGGINIP